ncbi:MAG: HPr family phosphocarrier protein [Lachnospiraceae bacterium]|nr:HPr family phosphocarrier protein [Lachnospiraceae bacterium]
MQEIQISLDTIEKVKQFVSTLARFEGDFELVSGKYIVNAKSILGLFSVDLSKPVLLRIDVDDEKREDVVNAIDEYRIGADDRL